MGSVTECDGGMWRWHTNIEYDSDERCPVCALRANESLLIRALIEIGRYDEELKYVDEPASAGIARKALGDFHEDYRLEGKP